VAQYNHDHIVPFEGSKLDKKAQVEKMFDGIAPKYDLLNRLMSVGVDVIWRKKVVKLLANEPKTVFLDLATGTADLAIMLAKLNPQKIIGADLSQQMLNIGDTKIKKKNLQHIIQLQKEDAENLSFESNFFQAATIAFGVRNFENLDKGLSELYRVIKPDGKLIILEFSKVKTFPIKQLFGFYFRYIAPIYGKLFGSKEAYVYLPESAKAFPEGDEMCRILQQIGFKNTTCTVLSFGIASIYQAQK
jgi:demethylmenaquinone methyltransferase / 2-methoxy-6-polyprenyl-1,4-benzoquinol methylase